MKKLTSGLAAILALLPAAAMAHTGTGAHIDAMHGFLHPLTGLDHVLAMVAVGVFAAQLGGRSLWAVPAAFVLAMVAGGALGYFGTPLPMVEQAIALSVIVMGLAVAFGMKLPVGPAMALVAVFAVFHGHAHGAEGSGSGSFLGYAVGFVVATALLHVAGVVLGRTLERLGGGLALNSRRLVGAAGAVAGAAILMG
ncbi:MAG: HupE/UreJ family protein [Pseudotabrizicola sp.]|uniref:HupE/UreJ family protein n=1 Tax=Pseudotabrizicola sp. TaxID=2939647 RepID=UPI00272F0D9E|nr:HupE/UreJ family protein [Pseudotabrizicola sp.]MDP2079395.1 HupE/UreJ family protein [Pseudotabrizicola sp.]MDZ7574086.1 HupE/UreJ family protein [Pseudotabrizicola sp.]